MYWWQLIYGNESEKPNKMHASTDIVKHFTAGNSKSVYMCLYLYVTRDFCDLKNYLMKQIELFAFCSFEHLVSSNRIISQIEEKIECTFQ